MAFDGAVLAQTAGLPSPSASRGGVVLPGKVRKSRGLDLNWTLKAGWGVEGSGSFPTEWNGQEVSKE